MQLPDLSAFHAVILVVDLKAFPPESCPELPSWLSSIPAEQASRSLIAVDSCDAIALCKRPSTEAEPRGLGQCSLESPGQLQEHSCRSGDESEGLFGRLHQGCMLL